MPTVPQSFVPGVGQTAMEPTPFAAPNVTPMQNRAPEQINRLGQSMEQAGGLAFRTGQTIGDRVQEQLDDAKTKAAETSFLQAAQTTLYDPKAGYFRQLGQTAVDQYEPAKQALADAGQKAHDSLTNDIQKQMFKRVLQQHLLSFGKQMADYNHGQSVAYATTESKARSENYGLLALGAVDSRYQMDADGKPGGDFAKYSSQMDTEAINAAGLAGFDPDSAQAKAMVKEQRTRLNQGVISRLLDNNDAYGAKKWYDEQLAAGNIDLRGAEVLGHAVKGEYDRQTEADFANKAVASALTPATTRNEFMAVANPRGMVEPGNLPIWNRPVVKNDDGSVSTEYSTSFEQNGKEVLVPTVVNGKFLTSDGKKPKEGGAAEKAMFKAAWDHYLKTGENLGKFATPEDADAYAGQLHNRGAVQGAPVTLAMPVSGGSINVTSGLGEIRAQGRQHDGIDIAVPVGTSVMAPADGKVLKVWNDEKFGGGLSMEIQLPNGNIAGFAHLSAANAREGDDVKQGMTVALSGKTGNATGPVLHYMMKDADGKYVDPRQVSQAQPNTDGIADPQALERSIEYIQNSDFAPDAKKRMIANVESQHGHARAIQEQKYQGVQQQARDAFFSSGGNYNAIPADVRLQLKPEDAYRFQKGLPKEDNVDVQAQFILNPENQTVDWVQKHRMDFTDSTYISYLGHAQAVANSADKERGASLDATQMDDVLIKNGFQNLVNPKSGSEDQAAAVALKTRIMDEFTSEQNQTGKELTRDQKGQIIRQTIMDQVSVHRSLWSDATGVPTFNLNSSQAERAYVVVGNQKVKLASIPPEDQAQITAALRSRGVPVTQQNIATYWVEGQKRRGKAVPTF